MKGTWFWVAPCGQELDVVRVERRQTGQGSDSTSLFSPFPGPQASTIQNPVISDVGEYTTQQLPRGHI